MSILGPKGPKNHNKIKTTAPKKGAWQKHISKNVKQIKRMPKRGK